MQTRENRGAAPDEFRLVRLFTPEHNLARLRKHLERLRRLDRATPVGRRVAHIARRLKRSRQD